jgi:hypothetical protein
MAKDTDFSRFESGTRRFSPSPRGSLQSNLTALGRKIREKRYHRTDEEARRAKIISDRINGERDD